MNSFNLLTLYMQEVQESCFSIDLLHAHALMATRFKDTICNAVQAIKDAKSRLVDLDIVGSLPELSSE